VETPASLNIIQGTMSIDAVIAKQVVSELRDPGAIGRVGLGLCKVLAQDLGSLAEVCGPS